MEIFGNPIPQSSVKKALKQKNNFAKKFDFNPDAEYTLSAEPNAVIGPLLGVDNIQLGDSGKPINPVKSLVVGIIRMGYGHYRIAMAIASAAHSMGIKPYWFDLLSFENTTGSKIINHLNKLYSFFSRLSHKSRIINYLFERETAGVHKTLNCNIGFGKMNELMVPVYKHLPKEIPFVGAHSWPSQGAIHAGMDRVVNVVPDNWPLGLHLSEGSIHTIQSPSAYMGYRTLKNMDSKKEVMNPISEKDIVFTGHYVDHELVSNVESDCTYRIQRMKQKKPRRFLMSIGGAGAEGEIYKAMIEKMAPLIKEKKIIIHLNAGDHKNIYDNMVSFLASLGLSPVIHTEWNDIVSTAKNAVRRDPEPLHIYYNSDIFAAVYATNLLMRCVDILVAKPSEFSYYPIPKLLVKRVGGHEAWGAIRSGELGDGTIECETIPLTLQALDLLLNDDDLLTMYCENIMKLKTIGIYDGAYNVVKIAMRNSKTASISIKKGAVKKKAEVKAEAQSKAKRIK